MGLLILDWAVLAAVSPLLKAAYPLPGPGLSWSAAWSAVATDAARAPLIVAVFTVVGAAAAIVVRNALGSFAVAGGFVLASLVAAGNLAAFAPWTLAYGVAGWMQFRSHAFVIYHFWVDGFPGSVRSPGTLTGSLGLLGVVAVLSATAVAVFRRVDITG